MNTKIFEIFYCRHLIKKKNTEELIFWVSVFRIPTISENKNCEEQDVKEHVQTLRGKGGGGIVRPEIFRKS